MLSDGGKEKVCWPATQPQKPLECGSSVANHLKSNLESCQSYFKCYNNQFPNNLLTSILPTVHLKQIVSWCISNLCNYSIIRVTLNTKLDTLWFVKVGGAMGLTKKYDTSQNFPSLSSRTRKVESLGPGLVSVSDSASKFRDAQDSDSVSDSSLRFVQC